MHKRNMKSVGFTIVELLIVVVVIAILAAISVIAYRGMQQRAADASVEADLASIIRKLELAKVDLGRYPQTAAEFPEFKFTKSAYDLTGNNLYYCNDKVNDRYAVGLRSKSLKGYLSTTGNVTAGVTINGAVTCDAIGKTFTNDATTYSISGWTGPPTSAWNSYWIWTN